MPIPYPTWVREPILEMYRQGLSSGKISSLTGVSDVTIFLWCKSEGISRSQSEAASSREQNFGSSNLMSGAYPTWVREPILEMYRQGLSYKEISSLTGVSHVAIWNWCVSEGIARSQSEATWKGDSVGYFAQHQRAIKDFPEPLSICRICETSPATDRARIDHTNLPYRKEYVLPMCHSCNTKHDLYRHGGKVTDGFVILFKEVP